MIMSNLFFVVRSLLSIWMSDLLMSIFVELDVDIDDVVEVIDAEFVGGAFCRCHLFRWHNDVSIDCDKMLKLMPIITS